MWEELKKLVRGAGATENEVKGGTADCEFYNTFRLFQVPNL